jgi:TolB-like protein
VTAADAVRSIAVLSLRNLSDDEQDYFSDGMTEGSSPRWRRSSP